MPTQTFKSNILLILYGEGKRNLTLVVCFHLLLKRERKKKKNVWHLQPISSIWRPLAFLPEKEMATHSSILAWRISGTEEPGGLLSMGLHRVTYDWSDLAAAAAAFLPTTFWVALQIFQKYPSLIILCLNFFYALLLTVKFKSLNTEKESFWSCLSMTFYHHLLQLLPQILCIV